MENNQKTPKKKKNEISQLELKPCFLKLSFISLQKNKKKIYGFKIFAIIKKNF